MGRHAVSIRIISMKNKPYKFTHRYNCGMILGLGSFLLVVVAGVDGSAAVLLTGHIHAIKLEDQVRSSCNEGPMVKVVTRT